MNFFWVLRICICGAVEVIHAHAHTLTHTHTTAGASIMRTIIFEGDGGRTSSITTCGRVGEINGARFTSCFKMTHVPRTSSSSACNMTIRLSQVVLSPSSILLLGPALFCLLFCSHLLPFVPIFSPLISACKFHRCSNSPCC